MLPQVLLLGQTSSQKCMVGLGRNPSGGTSSKHVANIKIDGNVTTNSDPLTLEVSANKT
jgi:hypothetical protein